ncbi:methyltransferase domain-containing protein [Patulibacter brassicae]|uniref:Methyltransferase domain-containing protein n=1 Tax=Patulibacter brassicae TaxID=1705717 RepID=A0ABU4VDY7_9ACTN|nr:methyltransferase [Patulibacter brassicae]MDX8150008.1 methyltransferase domain-containing protein [Patulibacter brassicae]
MALDPDRELAELQAYLGERFDLGRLQRHEDGVREEWAAVDDAERFYRTSESYLYDLTAFAMTGVKAPYHERLRALVPRGARVLDLGCGIGSDGLSLLEDGYAVTFADFDNPSTAYLRWRLAHRGHDADVLDLDALPADLPTFDAVYAFDVVEHATDPEAVLVRMEGLGGLVVANLLDTDGDELELHQPMPLRRLLGRAAPGLVEHRLLHERSHLVAYRPGVRPRRWRDAWRTWRMLHARPR